MIWAFLGGLVCGGTAGLTLMAAIVAGRRQADGERCIWCGGTGQRPDAPPPRIERLK